jgi:hypothetical protein
MVMNRLRLLGVFAICLFASAYAAVRMAWCIVVNPQRAWVMAIAHDELANAATGGDPGETISSRAFKAKVAGRKWGCVLCRLLDTIQADHCKNSEIK